MTIPNQIRYNDPHQQRMYQFNTQDSKVYLSRSTNYLLKAVGDDVVLSGFSLTTNPSTEDTISVTLSPGMLIQDSTLISILEPITLSLNIVPYDHNNGYIIIYTNYQYLNTITENSLSFEIAYISSTGNNISTSSWDPNKNRILLYRFSFIKLPVPALQTQFDSAFEIFSTQYTPMGTPNFTNYSAQVLDHASDSPTYGYASSIKAGHVRIGDNISINNGTISVANASQTDAGIVRFATPAEAYSLTSSTIAISPATLKDLIVNLKDIVLTVVDPGVTLGTALILS